MITAWLVLLFVWVLPMLVMVMVPAAHAISCKDQSNKDVDWFLASSVPHLGGEKGAWISTSAAPQPVWIVNDDGVNAIKGFLDNTMVQYKTDGVDMFVYNDHGSSLAHANGAVLWQTAKTSVMPPKRGMSNTAIWVTSSCPSFGDPTNAYLFGNCFTKVQHIQCFTFDPSIWVETSTKSIAAWFGSGNLDPREEADASFIKDYATSGRQLTMVLLHLMYRYVRFTLQQCLFPLTDTGNWWLLDQLCNMKTVAQMNNQLSNHKQWDQSYTFQTDLVTAGAKDMLVMSKKHDVTAALWDDIVIPRFDDAKTLTTWRISTFMVGDLLQLPAVCCYGAPATIAPFGDNQALMQSCRTECRPRNFVFAADAVKGLMNTGKICDGYYPWSSPKTTAPKVKAAEAAINAFILAASGEQSDPDKSVNPMTRWSDMLKPACFGDSSKLVKADITTLRDSATNQLTAYKKCWSDNINAVHQWALNRNDLVNLPPNPDPEQHPDKDPFTQPWSALSQDHSKLAWVDKDDWVCAGDLNRHGGTKKKDAIFGGNNLRGGGAVCWQSPTLRQSLDSFTAGQTYTCDTVNGLGIPPPVKMY